MTLAQMSPIYRESADLISARLRTLRLELRQAPDDPEVRFHLRQRIRALQPLLHQSRELAELTAHYYERNVARNDEYLL